MANVTSIGGRLSYDGFLCTIRWRGEIGGLKGQWLGVEWDDPSRGKHDGRYGEKRYFDCRSKAPTAASFIRPDSKRIDIPQSFLSAVREKYGSGEIPQDVKGRSSIIVISGKEVDEVGFDAISRKQSAWSDLTIVSLDGLRIDSLYHKPHHSKQDHETDIRVLSSGLKWKELDLSRNLFDDWDEITTLCSFTKELRVLNLNGNRFKNIPTEHDEPSGTFEQLAALSLANTAVEWDNIRTLCIQQRFPNLRSLSLAFNPLYKPQKPLLSLNLPTLTTLDLTSCDFCTLQPLSALTHLPALSTLILRSNPLTTLTTRPPIVFPHLKTLDLTSTHLTSLSCLNPIPTTFPILSSLKTTRSPLTTSHPSPRLITIARLPGLTTLNNTPIPPHERQNAEIYYLSTITPLVLATKTDEEEKGVVEEHPQWGHLCEKYGEPEPITLKRHAQTSPSQTKSSNGNEKEEKPTYPPLSVGANLITFSFHYSPSLSSSDSPSSSAQQSKETEGQQHIREIPKQTNIYRLKSLVGRIYSIPCLEIRLVLETDEWDPVPAAKPEDDDWSCSEDAWSEDEWSDDSTDVKDGEENMKKDKNLWVRREIELVDSTRPVAFWVEGREARVRVERRDLRMFD
ncbi:MAG: hypothetical protein Q9178_000437 [Gyalolechia marmorata]